MAKSELPVPLRNSYGTVAFDVRKVLDFTEKIACNIGIIFVEIFGNIICCLKSSDTEKTLPFSDFGLQNFGMYISAENLWSMQESITKVLDICVFENFGLSQNVGCIKEYSKNGFLIRRVTENFLQLVFLKCLCAKGVSNVFVEFFLTAPKNIVWEPLNVSKFYLLKFFGKAKCVWEFISYDRKTSHGELFVTL